MCPRPWPGFPLQYVSLARQERVRVEPAPNRGRRMCTTVPTVRSQRVRARRTLAPTFSTGRSFRRSPSWPSRLPDVPGHTHRKSFVLNYLRIPAAAVVSLALLSTPSSQGGSDLRGFTAASATVQKD